MSNRNPAIHLYVGLFALLYVVSLLVVGYTIIFLQIETGILPNIFALFASSSLTSYWFFSRMKRRFTKPEYIEMVIGSIAIDITVQVSTLLLTAGRLNLSANWFGYLSYSICNAAIISMSYSLWKAKPSPLPSA